jgi:hypothetical protein
MDHSALFSSSSSPSIRLGVFRRLQQRHGTITKAPAVRCDIADQLRIASRDIGTPYEVLRWMA